MEDGDREELLLGVWAEVSKRTFKSVGVFNETKEGWKEFVVSKHTEI